MPIQTHIRYLQREEIDNTRWEACINQAPNGLIYGRSFYLDAMTDGNWGALVSDDYTVVMPLPWKRKWGFTYLYQPHFMPNLGIFSHNPPDISINDFLKVIPHKFTYWDLDLNEANVPGEKITGLTLQTTARVNHFLSLAASYEEIYTGYKRLARRMLKTAADNRLEIIRQVNPAEVIEHYRKEYGKKTRRISREVYNRFTNCANTAYQAGLVSTYVARSNNNETVAFYMVFSDSRFVYSVLGGSTPAGKEKGAFYLLTDAVIRDHAGTKKTFRFEGSDIKGIAFFNTQFGAKQILYPHIWLNKLPFPINLLKKMQYASQKIHQ